MTISEARKRANAKWDKENMITIGCRVRRETADQFRQLCKANGTTISAVFLETMRKYINDHQAGDT